jgi:hypothetical protein
MHVLCDPVVISGLNELIPYGDWRTELADIERARPDRVTPDERKAILVEAFSECLAKLGKYEYVAETTVLRPVRSPEGSTIGTLGAGSDFQSQQGRRLLAPNRALPPDGRNVRGEPVLRLLTRVTVGLAARLKGMVAECRELVIPDQTAIDCARQELVKFDREVDGDHAVIVVVKDDGGRKVADASADRRGERPEEVG